MASLVREDAARSRSAAGEAGSLQAFNDVWASDVRDPNNEDKVCRSGPVNPNPAPFDEWTSNQVALGLC